MCTGLILDPKLEFATHKMNVTMNQPNKAHWARIKSILNEFQLYATVLGPTQYRCGQVEAVRKVVKLLF